MRSSAFAWREVLYAKLTKKGVYWLYVAWDEDHNEAENMRQLYNISLIACNLPFELVNGFHLKPESSRTTSQQAVQSPVEFFLDYVKLGALTLDEIR